MSPGWFLVLALLGAQRVHIGGAATPANGIVAPEVLVYTDPYYTREAREKKIEGTVTVEGSFDADGKMTVIRTVKGLGYGLDESAIAALRSWKFSPATRNTAPVATIAQIDIEFTLAHAPPAQYDGMIWASGTTIPKVLTRVEPQYTSEAAQARVTGTVVLQGVIGTDGSTKVVKIVKPLTLDLTLSAVEAIQQWTFIPANRDGKEIPVSVVIEVHFGLENR